MTDYRVAIINRIGTAAMYEQLAEECAELSKAALKTARIMRGNNPTPMTIDEAMESVQEEYTDVIQCGLELGITFNYGQVLSKHVRWTDRCVEHLGADLDMSVEGVQE